MTTDYQGSGQHLAIRLGTTLYNRTVFLATRWIYRPTAGGGPILLEVIEARGGKRPTHFHYTPARIVTHSILPIRFKNKHLKNEPTSCPPLSTSVSAGSAPSTLIVAVWSPPRRPDFRGDSLDLAEIGLRKLSMLN